MALSKKAQVRLERALRLFKSMMIYRTVGPHALSKMQLRELQMSGVLKRWKNKKISAPVVESYLVTHEQSSDAEPAPMSMRTGAINFLERTMERYVNKAADQLGADIKSQVENNVMMFDRQEGAAIFDTLKDPKNWAKNLRGELRGKVDDWEGRWKTIVQTELNRAANWGAMDAILNNNKALDPSQITVYKTGNKPGAGACKYCAKFWYLDDGVTPRTYRLQDLISNGSNHGKKAADWLPTIDSTHPNESHILHELRPGFGFQNGSIEYLGQDHDEHAKQGNK